MWQTKSLDSGLDKPAPRMTIWIVIALLMLGGMAALAAAIYLSLIGLH